MIEQLNLNCGESEKSTSLKLCNLNGVTIFVGPNNSGKSALLESIYQTVAGRVAPKKSALESIDLIPFENSLLESHPQFQGDTISHFISYQNTRRTLDDWVKQINYNWKAQLGGTVRQPYCVWMNGSQRLSMLPEEGGVSLTVPTGPLAKLFTNNRRRVDFQCAYQTGTGLYPIINHVARLGHMQLAFTNEKPDPKIERSIAQESIGFFENLLPREAISDGFNAYLGMLGTLFANDYKTIFIDEPEAFLHPNLARTLAKQIASHSSKQQVFFATHSSDFLMGAIESGINVRIIRLQYQAGIGRAHLLENDELTKFMNDPLLRSANVMSGLFAKAVIVTESDTDRAFYQEINTRLLAKSDSRAIDGAVFLNAQNKQTVARIVRLFRRMGVPAAGIVDLDFVCEGGRNWVNHMESISIPESMCSSLEISRKTIFGILKAVSTDDDKKNYKTQGGINLLGSSDKDAALDLLSRLGDYGLFVVEIGEVEQWLSYLNLPQSKHSWLHQIFERMGSDISLEDYVQPIAGDVWDFIGQLNIWFLNNDRKGMSQQ